jgi:iron(III) transport system substrate-binding protein
MTKMKKWIIGLLFAISLSAQAGTVRVITDRTETHLKPLFALFEKNTGIKVEAVYVDKGMMARLETRPTEADLVISSTAENLEMARKKNLLQPFTSEAISKLDKAFVDPDKMYVITSYRPRTLFYHKDRVQPEELSTYMALTDEKWKGRVSIRSGYHPYNMSLFCQMAEAEGLEKTEAFLKGLKANLARTPQGNDRAQVKAIFDGDADVSIGNAYYMGLMLGRDDQRPWGEATRVFFPNQEAGGAFVMRSAAGLTTSDRNVEEATQLLEYLLNDFAQFYFATTLHVYAVKDGVPVSELNKKLAVHQDSVKDGVFKTHFVSVRDIDKHREAVIEILNRINFDEKE